MKPNSIYNAITRYPIFGISNNQIKKQLLLISLAFLLTPFLAFTQTTAHGSIGLSLINVESFNVEENLFHHLFIDSKNGYYKPTVFLGLKLKRKISKNIYLSYDFHLDRRIVKALYECNDYTVISDCDWIPPFNGKAILLNSRHSFDFSFQLAPKLYLGIGGYYSMTNLRPQKWQTFIIPIFHRYVHQAGGLIKAAYELNKFTIEARFMKNVGNGFFPQREVKENTIKKMDFIELFVSYKFREFKKKEKKKRK